MWRRRITAGRCQEAASTNYHKKSHAYNHKRSGDFTLGGKRFTFRLVPAYPHELSKEFLLIDLLNNLKRLPDNTGLVRRNLKSHLSEFNLKAVRECLARYGRPASRTALEKAYGKTAVKQSLAYQ